MDNCQPYWKDKHYAYFCNKECECFPCHEGVEAEEFNCLFCYCPLYPLGENCGGDFTYTEKGIKNCENCLIPHRRENYGHIIDRFQEVARIACREEDK